MRAAIICTLVMKLGSLLTSSVRITYSQSQDEVSTMMGLPHGAGGEEHQMMGIDAVIVAHGLVFSF
jgi:hypothetical protein